MKESFDEEYYKINVLGEFGDYSSGLVVKGFDDANKLKCGGSLPKKKKGDYNAVCIDKKTIRNICC